MRRLPRAGRELTAAEAPIQPGRKRRPQQALSVSQSVSQWLGVVEAGEKKRRATGTTGQGKPPRNLFQVSQGK